ncbi:hypothetical protein [Pseudovibrio sp. POLY-S9]|uniref:hypothetical protein n=1 Tax=Pseudovibrio sp. POLY-S9 TaxID=1576596 RepID=UPI0007105269|nr:hypothetical protein [Pseudovibrio sp. POLY-S9]
MKLVIFRFFQAVFWITLFGGVLLHWWVGDVVIDRKFEADKYFFELRGQKDNWIETAPFLFWASYVFRFVMIFGCSGAALFALWQWLIKKD